MDLSDAVIINSSRLKSVVWNDFDRVKKGDICVAICRHCKKRLSGSSTSGTSHLRNHLIRCQRRSSHDITQLIPARERKRERPLAISNFSFNQEQKKDEGLNLVNIKFDSDHMKDDNANAVTVGSNYDQRRSQFDLARMIIIHGYPLNMVEDVGFKVFVKNLQPLFELVTVNKIEADCLEIYEKEKQKVFEVLDKLPGRISLSIDAWAGAGDVRYFCLAAYFIDESWQLKKKILNFVSVDSSHTDDMQADVIMTCLMDWDIDRKLFSMTFDGSSSDFFVLRIRDRLSQNRFLYGNGQLFEVRCVATVLNQMVWDTLESLGEVIHKIRESIRYLKSSQAMLEKFNKLAQQESIDTEKCLTLDNSSRWDSTYRMLEVALEYKSAFSLLREEDRLFTVCPSDVEWERAGAVTGFLNVFLEIMNDFSRSRYATANIYFPLICDIHLKLIGWCKSSDDYISSLALKMRSKFDEYWDKCSLGLAVAAFLDPRFKMKLVEYYFPQIYGSTSLERIDEISSQIKALYNEHSVGSPLSTLHHGQAWQVCGGSRSLSGPGNDVKDRLVGFDKFIDETSQSDGTKTDLDKYLEEPLFPRNVDFNVLNWWKVHTPRYPILSMMARNVLGAPMSRVLSESAFDMGGKVLDRDRSSLSAATLQALMCSQDWIRSELEG
ncbi:zinc finger BED domain-containing protein RICESLEEPER 1-like [Rhodamnia argentea]|uniref:Zinc finger BED domain-containing protein RICESLEEPER 1-like n=1 Tax=Rhodamnia argentea TaxID=178133 RepID=A0ABM3HN57_9MYRT|nr:zinc finger BED domain-containing protein RICESLEEPER 1-like [Rhodamnia argentea]XP_048138039.1 zinc finger BED domain-containing protein RICESLEEPER 1-like [Rhodamnia argentea]XP_048138040.1 zinc finger BED domain-containing protein RICESLEEPER 1-like [Rhodamnia argentea]XP_048138041.1 zinc finger BED domain-containing protein RICESLEEPER 1-like [Rhodamnia argentea]XP_048138042.1 zinc finger BED domain-containing protein RICESLEEPER 1-like [Rhodamnia argentea]